jgi:hypothetical protein
MTLFGVDMKNAEVSPAVEKEANNETQFKRATRVMYEHNELTRPEILLKI